MHEYGSANGIYIAIFQILAAIVVLAWVSVIIAGRDASISHMKGSLQG